jgi:hypothetical protein
MLDLAYQVRSSNPQKEDRIMTYNSLRFVVGAVFAFTLCSSDYASADQMDDFRSAAREAENNGGCSAIPWATDVNTCRSLSSKKDDTCRDYGCDKAAADSLKNNLIEKRKNLKDARDRKNQEAIPNLEDAIRSLDRKLADAKSEAGRRVRRCEDCLAARENVQRFFSTDEIGKKVKDTKPDEKTVKAGLVKDFEGYKNTLLNYYEKEFRRHISERQKVTAALDNCKEVSAMDWSER